MTRIGTTLLLSTLFATLACGQKTHIRRASYQRYQSLIQEYHIYQLPVARNQVDSFVQTHDIRTLHVQNEALNRKGQVKKGGYWTAYVFDAQGQIDSMYGGKRNQEMGYVYDYEFQGDTLRMLAHSDLKKGKSSIKVEKTYAHQPGKHLKYAVNHKGDTTELYISTGIDSTTLQSKDWYYKNGKLKYQWTNTYYPDYQLKQVVFENGKGKTLYIWDYQCAPEGKEITKQKDTSTVCLTRDTDAHGIRTIQYHSVDEHGKIVKNLSKYDSLGNHIYTKRSIGPNDEVNFVYQAKYEGHFIQNSESLSFHEGDTSYRTVSVYNSQGMMIEKTSYSYSNWRKAPKTFAQRISYDATGKPLQREEFVNAQLIHRSVFDY